MVFVVAFVVVQLRFVVAFLRERQLLLSSLILPPMFPAGLWLARDNPRRANNQSILLGCPRAGVLLLSKMEIEHQNPRSCDIPTPSEKLSQKPF